ncbi:MAG: DUF1456 family protein [Rectinemataceae bacterium]
MDRNDILRRIRYALNITDLKVIELFALAGRAMERSELETCFSKEGEEGYVECSDAVLACFLDGLIIWKRGPRGETGEAAVLPKDRLSNNDILKRLRIALELRDEDLIAIMGLAGVTVSKPELSALFRKFGHPNWRICGDQFLRNFLVGLTSKYRVV